MNRVGHGNRRTAPLRNRIAAFLDRDGTLNEDVDFLRTPEEVRMIPGAAGAVRRLNDLDFIVCVISNQSGVARGFLTEADLLPVHARIGHELVSEGARVDRFYYCPHHPTKGRPPYNIVCSCRKPAPGMLKQGEQDFGLDLPRSFVIGDRIVDVQAGMAVGATTVLVLTGYGKIALEECRRDNVSPDHVAPSLVEAVDFVVQNVSTHSRP